MNHLSWLLPISIVSGVSVYQVGLTWGRLLQSNSNLLIVLLAVSLGFLALTWTLILGYLLFRVDRRSSLPTVVPQPFVLDPRPSLVGVNVHVPLFDFMCKTLGKDDLKEIAFRLGIDYEELGGATKDGMAQSLLLEMWRDGRIEELYAEVRKVRPNGKI